MFPDRPGERFIYRNHRLAFLRVLLVALLLTSCLPGILWSQYFPPPLLLSFNLASDWDVATLEKLQLQQQATYFVTPQVARAYSEYIRKLSENSSIGLLYTASSTPENRFEVRQKIVAARQALAAVTGQEPVWFRSVPDKWHNQTLELAREAGFKYDSSESERKLVQDILPEFPIAASVSGIWQSIAVWKEEYRKRTITGRPYIVQVGIHTIDAYPEDLQALIDFVKNNGGRCLSYDTYLSTLESPAIKYSGVYLDLSRGRPDPEQVVGELAKAGITDAFLMAQDAAGHKYYKVSSAFDTTTDLVFVRLSKRLRAAGIRVHAWLAVNRNEQVALNRPELAMVDVHGKRSTKWVSPSHPKNAELKLTVHELIVNHDIDGIHLDYLGYPSLDFDFSEQAIRGFEQAYGEKISPSSPKTFLSTAYRDKWNSWRSQQLQATVLDAASTISGFSKKRLILSGALDAAAVTNYRQMEASAQDLSLLANGFDLIVVKLDLPSLSGNLWGERLAITPRLLAGNRPLLLASPFARSSASNEIGWSTQVEAARPWVQGIAYGYGDVGLPHPDGLGAPVEVVEEPVLADSQVSVGPLAEQTVERGAGETPDQSVPDGLGAPVEVVEEPVLAESQVSVGPLAEQTVEQGAGETPDQSVPDGLGAPVEVVEEPVLADSQVSVGPLSEQTVERGAGETPDQSVPDDLGAPVEVVEEPVLADSQVSIGPLSQQTVDRAAGEIPDQSVPDGLGAPVEVVEEPVLAESQVSVGPLAEQTVERGAGETPDQSVPDGLGAPVVVVEEPVLAKSQVSVGPLSQQTVERAAGEISDQSRQDVVDNTLELMEKTSPSDTMASEERQSQGAATETGGSIFSTLRFGLFLFVVVILLMLFAMRTFILRREKRSISEQPPKEEEHVPTVGLAEFLAGFIYTVKQITPDQGIGQTASKMVVILTSGDHFTMFHINPEREAGAPLSSQVPVTPHDIPKLSEEAYVDTTRLIEGNEDGFRIVGLVGLVPDSIKKTIRTQIAESQVIPGERQDQILREFN